ncbi:hypothetical protein HPB52_001511 [Rhipicephalus sanguineus]|uniref:Uncharacterized protein n=1 Tax=Rhipicephalus sanguineus TaxID=34632 RepID=A0A9D4T2E6_RHISA|nr:hypothetical protein HPB52_001511 [Rhipicephalus sanguineus]
MSGPRHVEFAEPMAVDEEENDPTPPAKKRRTDDDPGHDVSGNANGQQAPTESSGQNPPDIDESLYSRQLTKWDDACYTVFGSNAISFVDCVDHSCFTVFQSHGFCAVHCVTAYGFGDIFFVDAGSTCCVCFTWCGVPCACACASVHFRCASAGRACRCAGARASVHFADASASQACPTATSTFSLWNASFARRGGLAKRV